MLSAIPLLSIVLLLANLVAFGAQTGFAEPLFALPLPSGGTVAFDTGDALILLGLATRFSALALLAMTATIQVFVYPDAYPMHGVWAAVLLFLVARGAGPLSLDALVARRFGGR